MYSLRNYLKKRLGEDDNLIRCQFACAVLMPDCSFYASDPEVIDDILFDRKSNWTLDTIRDKSFDYWRRTCREKHQFEGKRLSEDEIERLGKLLRGDFGSVPALRSEIDSVSNEIYALTKEQYEVLEALSDNPRILVSGAAGTGKTLLAVEQAKRAFWEGRSVLFLCYNRSVAQFVSALFIREQVNIPAITLHALMMRECGIKWSDELDHSWFSQILPDMFLKRENITSFDTVIVDEGQDLLNNVYIQCIDRLVSGGIRTGVWTVYYDSNQNLFSTWHMLKDTLDYLKCKTSVASYRLRVNCRNTKQIADANTLISNFSDRGRAIINGPQTKFIAYNDKHHEYELLNHIICELIQFGVMGSDITILSKYSLSNPLNVLSNYRLDLGSEKLKTNGEMWTAENNEIRFSTIPSFKGLESNIIVLIDVDRFDDLTSRQLNYVAASRACVQLYVLFDSSADDERQRMIRQGSLLIFSA